MNIIMKKNGKGYKKELLYGLLGIVIFILLWFLVSAIVQERKLIFPSPIDTIQEFGLLLKDTYTYKCIAFTLFKATIGFLFALIMAIIFGIFGGIFKKFHLTFSPLVTALKAIPTASFLFLFIVMVNYDYAPVLVVIFICFPGLYDAVVGGITNIDKQLIDATRIESKSILYNVRKVYFPLAFNYIAVGMTATFGLALKVEIMAEIISGSTGYGIGNAIRLAQQTSVLMAPIFAWTLISVILLLSITYLLKVVKSKLIKKDF